MDRHKILNGKPVEGTWKELVALHETLFSEFKDQFDRSLPLTDEILDRWERAKKLNWGEGSSVYDSAYIFGDVQVGKNSWIGPFTIIDGSGGLRIGSHCTISAAVHIYSHDNLKQTLSGGRLPIDRSPVEIGDCSYVGPHSIITKGVTIGKHCVVASNSFVNKNVEDYTIVAGNPAKAIGKVVITGDDIKFDYNLK